MGTIARPSGGGKKKSKLLGTYSSNTNINVSDYKPKSVSEFVAVSNSAGTGAVYKQFPEANDGQMNCGFTAPSLSLNNNILSVTCGSVSSTCNCGGTAWTASTGISVKVYYIGELET